MRRAGCTEGAILVLEPASRFEPECLRGRIIPSTNHLIAPIGGPALGTISE